MLKKLSLLVVLLITVIGLSGCSSSSNVEGSLEELMTKVYESIPEDERPMMLMNPEINEENIEYYLGTKDIEYEEALASESAVGAIAHSVVLVRTKDNADIETIKSEIKEKVNPRKWVCVGVEREDLIVKNKGNLIILIMVEDENTRTKLEEGFNNL